MAQHDLRAVCERLERLLDQVPVQLVPAPTTGHWEINRIFKKLQQQQKRKSRDRGSFFIARRNRNQFPVQLFCDDAFSLASCLLRTLREKAVMNAA
jgi:hypothetical protein